jgi:hypothetical protein
MSPLLPCPRASALADSARFTARSPVRHGEEESRRRDEESTLSGEAERDWDEAKRPSGEAESRGNEAGSRTAKPRGKFNRCAARIARWQGGAN